MRYADVPRLIFPKKDRLVYGERGKRKNLVLLVISLFIKQTRVVGLSQIQTVFMPFLSLEAQYLVGERFQF